MRNAAGRSLKVVEGMPKPEMMRADGGLLFVGTVTEKGKKVVLPQILLPVSDRADANPK